MNENSQNRARKGRGKPMKDIELRVISQLMKNSRRSDRQLAKTLRVTQPTVSRTIRKLEKEGVIREYTMIPNFERLGYKIVAFTLLKLRGQRSPGQLDELRKRTLDYMQHAPAEIALFERGLGAKCDAIEVTFHRDYASFQRLRDRIKRMGIFNEPECMSFLVDLEDEIHFRYFTLATLANEFLDFEAKKKRDMSGHE